MPRDKETGQSRGFAFVEMETVPEEAAAIEALNGSELMGRKIKVNQAKPRKQGGSSKGERRKSGGTSSHH